MKKIMNQSQIDDLTVDNLLYSFSYEVRFNIYGFDFTELHYFKMNSVNLQP
jgi:hypothetical protein